MPTCKDCKFFRAVNEKKGDCFGQEVSAEMDSLECPTSSFQPKIKG